MEWTRFVMPAPRGLSNPLVMDMAHDSRFVYSVTDVGGGVSCALHRNEVIHLIILMNDIHEHGKPGCKGLEPNYSQKLRILKERGRWGDVAIEVMPPQDEVVDVEDVYHIWEFQYIYSFFWNVTPIFDEPPEYEETYEGIQYHREVINKAMYIYFKDRENMPWRRKQQLKNHAAWPTSCGVEFICEAMANTNHGCILVLPPFESLDFGLEPPLY